MKTFELSAFIYAIHKKKMYFCFFQALLNFRTTKKSSNVFILCGTETVLCFSLQPKAHIEQSTSGIF